MRTYPTPARGRARELRLLRWLALLVWCVPSLAAQQRRNLVELSAAGVYQSFDNATDLGGAAGGVGRLAFWLPAGFSIEAEGSFAKPKTQTADSGVTVRTLALSLLYNIPVGASSTVYLKLGGGNTNYGHDCPTISTPLSPICGSSGALLAGGGFRAAIAQTVQLRGEGLLNRNKSDSESLSNFGVNLGLSVMLGSRPIPDSDGDGILNNRDRCPDTPIGARVDSRGCTSDGDGDGVPDGVDRCPSTPPGATVDESGCTKDSDGDNIADGLDKCPDTQAGVLVDPTGCPRDTDGDQIPDGLDRCSDTPRGATVDALGCPGDEDGDGVLDGLDRCPRTPAGQTVTSNGCATAQDPNRPAPAAPAPAPSPAVQPAPRQPARPAPRDTLARRAPPAARQPVGRPASPIVAGVISGVGFVPGTARLTTDSYVALDSIVEILRADTTLRVEVSAHTDNSIQPMEAQRITGLQADAVRNYLVTKGVLFQQVDARGYGSSVPLTPDNTPRGRAANRRVEIRRQTGP